MVTDFRHLIMALGISAGTFMCTHAQYIKTDPMAAALVYQNLGIREGYEIGMNEQTKETQKTQDDTQKKVAHMAAITEGMKEVMANAKGFGVESSFYKQIVADMSVIVQKSPLILTEIQKRPALNSAFALANMGAIVERATSLVDDFCTIVNNGKIKNPFRNRQNDKEDDGDNYMQREKRLEMAVKISYDISRIRQTVEIILLNYRYASLTDLWIRIDYKSWAYLVGMQANATYVINMWNQTFNE